MSLLDYLRSSLFCLKNIGPLLLTFYYFFALIGNSQLKKVFFYIIKSLHTLLRINSIKGDIFREIKVVQKNNSSIAMEVFFRYTFKVHLYIGFIAESKLPFHIFLNDFFLISYVHVGFLVL